MSGLTIAVGFAPKQCHCWEGEESAEMLQWWQRLSSVPSHTDWGKGGVRALLQPYPLVPAQNCLLVALLTTDVILGRLILPK